MFSRWIPAWAVRQALLLLLAAGLTGLAANQLNPHRVALQAAGSPVVAGIAGQGQAATMPRPVTLDELHALLRSSAPLLIDARDHEAWLAGHLPGAISLPFEGWPGQLERVKGLPNDRWLVCYCDGGGCELSELLAQALVQQGFTRVAVFRGGIAEWQASGGSVTGEEVAHD